MVESELRDDYVTADKALEFFHQTKVRAAQAVFILTAFKREHHPVGASHQVLHGNKTQSDGITRIS